MNSETFIHPTAVVSPEARLGCGVRVGPYCVVESDVQIGDGTILESFVCIKDHVEIGKNCRIHEYAAVGGAPQDHDFDNELTYVRVGDDVIIRENVTIHRATGEGCETSVGSGSMIMEGCHLAHNVKMGVQCTITNKVGFAGHVELGDYVVIGGLSGFHQFVKVGSYAMVGGLSKIIKDVPPYSMVDGHPARVYGLNTVGLRRRGFTQEQRMRIKNIYKLLYDRHVGRRAAIALVEERYRGDEFAEQIVAFVRSLKRGLTSWMDKDFRRRGEGDAE